MADLDPRLFEEMIGLQRQMLHVLAGGDPKSLKGTSKSSHLAYTARFPYQSGLLGSAVSKTTETFKILHGSLDDFVYSLKRMIPTILGGEVISLIVKSVVDLSRTYSKLTDIGQTFGGSMFEMARQAGAAGLSLDEYAKMLEKNSVLSAVLNNNQSSTVQTLGQFQKGVRTSLDSVGLYGMTLGDLTDASSDYEDNLRRSGLLFKTSSQDQQEAFKDLLLNVTALSAATGKSRQELLKQTTEIMRGGGVLEYLQQHSADKNIAQVTKNLNGLAAAAAAGGPEISQMFADLVNPMTRAQAMTEGFGADLIKVGLGDVVTGFTNLIDRAESGQAIEPKDFDALISQFNKALSDRSIAQLPGGKHIIEVLSNLRDVTTNLAKDRAEAAKPTDAKNLLTRAANAFEDTFQKITGAFRENFYQGIMDAVGTGGTPAEQLERFKTFLANLTTSFANLGTGLGKIAGVLGKQETIDGFVTGLSGMLTIIKDLVKGFTWLRDSIATVTGKGWATVITLMLAWVTKRFAAGLFAFTIRNAVIRVGRSISGGFGGGRGGEEEGASLGRIGGVEGAAGVAGGGARQSWKQKIKSSFSSGGLMRSWGGILFGAITGLLADVVVHSLADIIPDFPFKDTIVSVLGGTLGVAAGLFGPALITSFVSYIGTAVFGAISTFMTGDALAAAIALAVNPEVWIPLLIAGLAAAAAAAIGSMVAKILPQDVINEANKQRDRLNAGESPTTVLPLPGLDVPMLPQPDTTPAAPVDPSTHYNTNDGYDGEYLVGTRIGKVNPLPAGIDENSPEVQKYREWQKSEQADRNAYANDLNHGDSAGMLLEVKKIMEDIKQLNIIQVQLMHKNNDLTSDLTGFAPML